MQKKQSGDVLGIPPTVLRNVRKIRSFSDVLPAQKSALGWKRAATVGTQTTILAPVGRIGLQLDHLVRRAHFDQRPILTGAGTGRDGDDGAGGVLDFERAGPGNRHVDCRATRVVGAERRFEGNAVSQHHFLGGVARRDEIELSIGFAMVPLNVDALEFGDADGAQTFTSDAESVVHEMRALFGAVSRADGDAAAGVEHGLQKAFHIFAKRRVQVLDIPTGGELVYPLFAAKRHNRVSFLACGCVHI